MMRNTDESIDEPAKQWSRLHLLQVRPPGGVSRWGVNWDLKSSRLFLPALYRWCPGVNNIVYQKKERVGIGACGPLSAAQGASTSRRREGIAHRKAQLRRTVR